MIHLHAAMLRRRDELEANQSEASGVTSDWGNELEKWLKPFLDRLGHKARRLPFFERNPARELAIVVRGEMRSLGAQHPYGDSPA